jgi:hypothetical protein
MGTHGLRANIQWLMFFVIVLPIVVSAQNVQRIEEEAVLEQERRRRVEELLKAREQEEKRINSMNLTDESIAPNELVDVEPNNVLPRSDGQDGAAL